MRLSEIDMYRGGDIFNTYLEEGVVLSLWPMTHQTPRGRAPRYRIHMKLSFCMSPVCASWHHQDGLQGTTVNGACMPDRRRSFGRLTIFGSGGVHFGLRQ